MTITDTTPDTTTVQAETETRALTTSDLASVRGISTTAVRQGALRDPLGAPAPDTMALGRGRPWTWSPDREDVRVYLMKPDTLAEVAERIKEREGSISGAARAVGVDRATFQRVIRGTEWSQFGTALKVMKAASRG